MKILAFETSCDETGIALVQGETLDQGSQGFAFRTLKAVLLSQAALHAEYGGVYPNLAKREHEKNLPILYREFASSTGSGQATMECDAVAVTVGPGLEPALWQGVEFAKRVASERGVPLLPVNHMEAHLISSLTKMSKGDSFRHELGDVSLPVLALLISGGHTEFVLMRNWFEYEVLGQTLDDAVGECFDKVARMLGLPYPGGPEISRLASKYRGSTSVSVTEVEPRWKLPRPMIGTGTCDVSFSGLKTAALYALRDYAKATPSRAEESPLTQDEKAAFAAEFEEAVGDVFVAKTRQALTESGARTFVIGGGVAANTYLCGRLQKLIDEEFSDIEFRLPDPSMTGDNAIMIAQCALARRLSGLDDAKPGPFKAVGNLLIGKLQ